jgi:hypothetical protein
MRKTLLDLKYGKKISNMWKMRNEHCMTWNIVRKMTNKKKGKLTW